MRINHAQSAYVRVALENTQGRRKDQPEVAEPRARGGDKVEFSGAALAKRYQNEGLTAGRIGELRQQIERGVHNEPGYVEELAWRLIEAGIV